MVDNVMKNGPIPRVAPEVIQRKLAQHPPRKLQIDGYAPAAVLVPLLRDGDGDRLLFTRRTDKVEHHKGQISFPGGRQDPGENLLECALRETEEEVGVDRADVEILGRLDDTWTPSRYVISPYVGLVRHPYEFVISEDEIDDLLIVELERLLNPAHYTEQEMHHEGRSALVPFFHVDEIIIWGATARILKQFLFRTYEWEEP
ncbi:MAG: CoA pyrophosphatase [Candidatus Lernaella stagnicola]|nr:CoA pyrophosphatase [Candidatus Lernaella stagnicola]